MVARRSGKRDRSRRSPPEFRVETLESRVLFSADAAFVAGTVAPDASPEPPPAVATLGGTADAAGAANAAAGRGTNADGASAAASAVDGTAEEVAAAIATADVAANAAAEIVVIDADTPDIEALLADLAARGEAAPEVIVLDENGAAAALARLGEILAGRTGLGAVHLVSHGADGELLLGGERVTTLDLIARAEEIAAWRDAFADGADFLLYGCGRRRHRRGAQLRRHARAPSPAPTSLPPTTRRARRVSAATGGSSTRAAR